MAKRMSKAEKVAFAQGCKVGARKQKRSMKCACGRTVKCLTSYGYK